MQPSRFGYKNMCKIQNDGCKIYVIELWSWNSRAN